MNADTTANADVDAAPGRDAADIPSDVSDADLWLGALDLAARHAADPANPGRCGNPHCSDPRPYPCFARRLADRSASNTRRGCALEPTMDDRRSSLRTDPGDRIYMRQILQ
jgi:hypothetical protein